MTVHRPQVLTNWFWVPEPRPEAALRLFCFPHAGGNAPAFRELGRRVPADVEVWAVQMPGRGSRIRESVAATLDEHVSRVMTALRPFLDKPYALLGQSLGALVAYEAGRELARSGQGPSACVLASLLPPHLWTRPPGPDDSQDLVSFLSEVDSSVGEVLADPELRRLVLSVVSADLALCEDYRHEPEPRLDCPVAAIVGDGDTTVSPAQMREWQDYTVGPFSLSELEGHHLILQAAAAEAASTITTFLSQFARRPPDTAVVA